MIVPPCIAEGPETEPRENLWFPYRCADSSNLAIFFASRSVQRHLPSWRGLIVEWRKRLLGTVRPPLLGSSLENCPVCGVLVRLVTASRPASGDATPDPLSRINALPVHLPAHAQSRSGKLRRMIRSRVQAQRRDPQRGPRFSEFPAAAIPRRARRSAKSKGRRQRYSEFQAAESIGAGEQTLAALRRAAQWLAAFLPTARCAQAFRYRGTRPLEPDSSSAAG